MSSFWRSSSTTSLAAILATTTVTAAIGISWYLLVDKYGTEGALRYIWEGDPYPMNVREYLDILDEVHDNIIKEENILDDLEVAFERAKLDSIDDDTNTPIKQWENNVRTTKQKIGLEKSLARISYNLDQLAAKVDAIPSEAHVDLKLRKKSFSTQIVSIMERADALIAIYKEKDVQEEQ